MTLAVVLGAGLTAGAAPWPLRDPGALQAIARQVEGSTGMDVTATGTPRFRLLPRPTIEVGTVSFRARDDAVRVDAERMRAGLDLPALAAGQVRLTHVWLDRPTVSLDADRVRAFAEPMLRDHAERFAALLRTSGLTLQDGVIRICSSEPAVDSLLTDVSATFAWPSEDAGASLTGTASWRGIAFAVSADLDSPDALVKGGDSLGSVHVRSDPIDLQVIATVSPTGGKTAVGRIEASTPDLSAFLRLIGHPAPQLGGIERARLEGSMAAGIGALSISDATLGLDDMQFEGALAVRRKGDRPALAATLATDRIDLSRFLGELPAFTGHDGSWTGRPLVTGAIADDEIDLRVSAAHATLGPFLIEDSSLSLQSGEGRLELSLGEARAYDGLLKARLVAQVEGDVTVARLDAALSRLDLQKLLKEAGEPIGSGILTGHAGVEARGSSPDSLTRTAKGRGEFTVRDGELFPAAARALMRQSADPLVVPDELGSGFDDVAARFRIARGVAMLGDSWVTWPSARATLSGTASLPDQRLDLRAVVGPTQDGGDPLAFELAGPWRDLRLTPVRPPS